jgi:spore maturation protein SpmB
METFRWAVGVISVWTIPVLFLFIVGYGMIRRVNVYESFVEGGKEGFNIFLKILPYLVAILVAIGMLRTSGVLEYLSELFGPYVEYVRLPAVCLPMSLMKPLSGSGSLGLASEVIQAAPDSYQAYVASTIFGATDTTFYVIALYFGTVGVKKIRQALIAGLVADIAGILAAVNICYYVFNDLAVQYFGG